MRDGVSQCSEAAVRDVALQCLGESLSGTRGITESSSCRRQSEPRLTHVAVSADRSEQRSCPHIVVAETRGSERHCQGLIARCQAAGPIEPLPGSSLVPGQCLGMGSLERLERLRGVIR